MIASKMRAVLLLMVIGVGCLFLPPFGACAEETLPQKIASPAQADQPSTPTESGAQGLQSKVVAYYFHGTARCVTCRKIEAYSREAIEKYFANELKSGNLQFKTVNVDEPQNNHYIQDYQLFTKSLVISLHRNGKEAKWKNLQAVWTHVNDEAAFLAYVKGEVETFLQEAK